MFKIVLVDDDNNARSLLRYWLEGNGFAVFESGDGKAGLELIKAVDPDVVSTDIFMPKMNGLQLITILAMKRPELPILAITGIEDALESAKESGARDGLLKPIAVEKLLSAVQKSLNVYQTQTN